METKFTFGGGMEKPRGSCDPVGKQEAMDSDYSFTRHQYDIDVFEIYDGLKKKYSVDVSISFSNGSNIFDFLKEDEDSFIRYMKSEGHDLIVHQKQRHFILPSSFDPYHNYLAWKVFVIDVYKIEALLSYLYYRYHSAFFFVQQCCIVSAVEAKLQHGLKQFLVTVK